MNNINNKLSKTALQETHSRIIPYIHRTPVLTSRLLNEASEANLFLKCENFQKMGAFKMRGALNAIIQLSDEQKKNGVVTHSSGNFAQALALAAKELNTTAYIVMPSNAPQVKKNAVKDYGGKIFECEPTVTARESMAEKIRLETKATFIHPYNDNDVILGQGTAAMELIEEAPKLDYLFAPVGGGGLISGTALACNFFTDNCVVIGGEPYNVDDAYRSLVSGKIENNSKTNTIADGLKTNLGDKTFPIIQNYVDRIIRVTEEEIISAMRFIWERMKIIIEPSSAVPFAALLKEKEKYKNKNIGLIISGGNVDLSQLPF
jgi:threonine dehydratase